MTHASKKRKKRKRAYFKSNPLLKKALSFIAGMFVQTVMASWRVTGRDTHPETQKLLDAGKPVIFALWHGRMYCLLKNVPKDRVTILVSPSNDGDFITRASEWLGFKNFIRGSQKQSRT